MYLMSSIMIPEVIIAHLQALPATSLAPFESRVPTSSFLTMRLPIHSAWLLFVFLVSFASAVFDLNQELDPEGALQVRLDYGFALRSDGENIDLTPQKRNVVFSSVLSFAGSANDISDGQLVQMCLDAYGEMVREGQRYGVPGGSKPSVMTVLAIGKLVILASSQRGPVVFTNLNSASPVSQSLNMCQLAFADVQQGRGEDPDNRDHKNERKCGEIMSAHLWFRIMEQAGFPQESMRDYGGRIVSCSKYRGSISILRPCGSGEQVGPRYYHHRAGLTLQ
jgi:hypothetical protein